MWLVYLQRRRVIGWFASRLLMWRGTDINSLATVGPGLRLPHAGTGIVVHSHTRIGAGVAIYQNVTVGRADVWRPDARFAGVEIGDGAVLCAGAVILGRGNQVLQVGAGTIVGANAVLTRSTGEREIWAGAPAVRVGDRDQISRTANTGRSSRSMSTRPWW